jgi:hypothetical protein
MIWSWHYRATSTMDTYFLNRRRQGNPDSLEELTADSLALAADREAFAVFFNGVAFRINPFKFF